MSRACVEVNLSAIAQNFKSIKSRTTADVLAVVKADAYGHGLIPVSKALEDAGADWFGTALLEEAINLRKAGILKPIISWLTPLGEDFKSAIDLDIDLGIPSIDLLNEVIKAASLTGKAARIHLEIDTGMSRGGVLSEWDQLIKSVLVGVNLKQLKVIGIWSYFVSSYGPYWYLIAFAVSFSLVGVIIWGTLMGSIFPLALKRLGLDPAVSSAPFVATLVDVTGLLIYFSFSIMLLKGILL